MKETKIVFLPLDERPCNVDFPRFLAEGIPSSEGIDFVEPPSSLFGYKKKAADVEGIWSFLLKECHDADILILPVDTLVYGGLIPSRIHHLPLEEIERRMDRIPELKKENPNLKIYAYQLVMRCPSFNTGDEEPDYYARCGEAIYLEGVAKHRLLLGEISKQEYEETMAKLLPLSQGHEKDYLERRRINLEAMKHLLPIAKGNFDVFLNPQDDCHPYGYTSMDREELKEEQKKLGMSVLSYPGADEVGMMLLARALLDHKNISPKIKVIYPKEECKSAIPLGEDRPIEETLKSQLQALNAIRVEEGQDLTLYMNYPTHDVVNMSTMVPGDGYPARDLPAFSDQIAEDVNVGKPVILADGAYCNGGDNELVEMLSKKTHLLDLYGYAGWNSSSNSLGTALAEGTLSWLFGRNEKTELFLAERFYEDCGYCGHARYLLWTQVIEKYGLEFEDAKEEHGIGAKLCQDAISDFMNQTYPELSSSYELVDCSLPWKRFFEVRLSLKAKEK